MVERPQVCCSLLLMMAREKVRRLLCACCRTIRDAVGILDDFRRLAGEKDFDEAAWVASLGMRLRYSPRLAILHRIIRYLYAKTCLIKECYGIILHARDKNSGPKYGEVGSLA